MTSSATYQFQIRVGYTIEQLLKMYQTFIPRRIQQQLEAHSLNEPGLGVIVTHQDTPIGLALVQFEKNGEGALLLSLFVLPKYQQQGLDAEIITRLEKILHTKGYNYLDWMYVANWPEPTTLARMVEQSEWHLWYTEEKAVPS